MVASIGSLADLDWIVSALAARRDPLVEYAPVFWRPAVDAADKHREFLAYLMTEGGARVYRTDSSVLVAASRGDGWLVDDLYVADHRWDTVGRDLWNALAADCEGAPVRFVCPVYEQDRAEFAARANLHVQEAWWLLELDSAGGQAGVEVALPGADAITVGSPPVYAPLGPILFLPAPIDASVAVPAAIQRAPDLGCAAIVVSQVAGDEQLAKTLGDFGLRRHCEFFAGTIGPL